MNQHIPDRHIPEFGASQGAFTEGRKVTIAIAVICGLAIAHGVSPAIAHLLNTAAILIGTGLGIAALTWVIRVYRAGRYTPVQHTRRYGRPRVGAR